MKKQTHLSIPPLLLPYPAFFAQKVAIAIVIAIHPNNRQ
jgi:hypothetical protein